MRPASTFFNIQLSNSREMYHYESKTRGMEEGEKLRRFECEVAAFRAKWKKDLDAGDPYYNPNFTLDAADYSLKME